MEEEMRERHMRLQQEEIRQREAEHAARERQHQEQYQSMPQHQNNTGAIPIHQPVASRVATAIHSPGGLLASHAGGPPPNPLGAPTGPGSAFGGPLHADANRALHSNASAAQQQAQQQHQMFGPGVLNHNGQNSAQMNPQQNPQANIFGGPLQQAEAAARVVQQMPFANGMPANHPQAQAQALGQGQQPILNVSGH